MAMIIVSLLVNPRISRWANVAAGAIMSVVQAGTLFAGVPTIYYVFFSIIEIATTAAIVWLAWRWVATESARQPGEALQGAS